MSGTGEITGRVRVLSDLHLAHPASQVTQVASLRPLLEGAETVVFNGDTCEQKCGAWREEGRSRLEELRALCAEVGAKPVFLAGNHDGELAERGWLDLVGGALFVTHGHMVYPEVAPWSHEYLRRRREIGRLIEERRVPDEGLAHRWETACLVDRELIPAPGLNRSAGGYLWSALWPPARLFHIARVWTSLVDESFAFLERFRPDAQMMLFGHFHRPGVWTHGSRRLVNTGAFMRGAYPLVVEVEAPWVRVRRIDHDRDGFHPAATLATFRLAP